MAKSKRNLGSDLAKVDAHIIQPHEYDEIPELTDEWFAAADYYVGGKLVQRGRPLKEKPKKATNVRFDAEVLDAFRAMGKGWQTRMNDVLKTWVHENRPS